MRRMLVVGESAGKYIHQYSSQFQSDFLRLLRTGHGEKQVQINQFYQEYISNKVSTKPPSSCIFVLSNIDSSQEHIHMNATRWSSLTEFAKFLGREGICRVEENDKGVHIAWIDNSPEALRRQDALRKKAAQDQGDEELEQRIIKEQIRRAQESAAAQDKTDETEEHRELKRQEGEKITLSFGSKPKAEASGAESTEGKAPETVEQEATPEPAKQDAKPSLGGISMKMTAKPQTKNVFAQAKKNALASGTKKSNKIEQPKKVSEAERIMREEMEKKRPRGSTGFSFGMPPGKKARND